MFVPAKKIDTLYVTTTLTSQFFSSLICVNFTKRKNNWKKTFFRLYVRCVNKNQRPFQTNEFLFVYYTIPFILFI